MMLTQLSGALKCALFVVIALVLTPVVRAQDLQNLYMAGGSYNAGASPAFAGSALYAHQVSTTGTYAFAMMDALPNTIRPFTVTTNVGAGIAQKIVTIDGVPVFIPTSAGISYTGPNTGWSWATGAAVPFKFRSSVAGGGWYVMPTVRVIKSSVSGGTGYQPIVGLLVGWGK